MDLFKKSRLTVFLSNNFIGIYSEIEGAVKKLDLPGDIVNNQEVLDKSRLEKLISELLTSLRATKQEVVLILLDPVVFSKIIPVSELKQNPQQIPKFFAEIPFEPKDISQKILENGNEIYIMAAHKGFYNIIKDIFEELGWKVSAVVPITVFKDINKEAIFTPQIISYMMLDEDTIRKGNFLVQEGVGKQAVAKPNSPKNLYMMFFLIAMVVAAISVLTFLVLKPIHK